MSWSRPFTFDPRRVFWQEVKRKAIHFVKKNVTKHFSLYSYLFHFPRPRRSWIQHHIQRCPYWWKCSHLYQKHPSSGSCHPRWSIESWRPAAGGEAAISNLPSAHTLERPRRAAGIHFQCRLASSVWAARCEWRVVSGTLWKLRKAQLYANEQRRNGATASCRPIWIPMAEKRRKRAEKSRKRGKHWRRN